MFGIFVHYSARPIYDVSMNLLCWPPSVDIFNILLGFLWQPLLKHNHDTTASNLFQASLLRSVVGEFHFSLWAQLLL